MSDSPEPRAHSDDAKVDEIDDNSGEPEAAPQNEPQPKRKRGRPPGSKNKKTLEKEAATGTAGPSAEAPRRPRGRPPKTLTVYFHNHYSQRKPEEEKKAEGGEPSEPPPKRKRGRPRKNPLPEPSGGEEGEPSNAAEAPPAKRKRGRPPKNAS
ncbi:hypothetical protein BV20DRAFT_976953 [Pilatotrama ljubarskyi]|nr:hypothetical protein BV20DRAFT_976953 [Pilatotrama ljubarskyi]